MNSIRPISLVIAVASLLGTSSTQAQGFTREQVRSELAEAIRNGDMIADYQTMQTYRQLAPHRYPAGTVAAGKTREQVRQELAEAIRTGDVLGDSHQGLTAYELAPHRYPARPVVAGKTKDDVRAELELALRLGETPINEQGQTPAQQFPSKYAAAIAEHQLAKQLPAGEQSAKRVVQSSAMN